MKSNYPPDLYVPFFDEFINHLVEISGLTFDGLCFLVLIGAAHVLGFGYRFLPSTTMRHLYGLILGFPFQFLMYREKVLIWWIPQVATYFICMGLGRKCVLPIIILLFGALLAQHYYMFTFYYLVWEIDVSQIMMLGGMKGVAFAFSYADGFKSQEELEKYAKNVNKRNPMPVMKEVEERAIKKLPSFFEYLSYMNNFQTGFTGPYFDYMEYDNWIQKRGCYKNIPFSIKPFLRKFFFAAFFGYLFAVWYPKYPTAFVLEDEFKVLSYVEKIMYLVPSAFLLSSKYQFGWHWMQISNITTGIAYNQDEHGNDIWDYINTQDARSMIPIGMTVRAKIEIWNIQCTKFFRRFCYNRWAQIFRDKFGCLCLVFLMNAIWHGFYPSIWFMPIVTAFEIEAARCCYRFWTNRIKGSKFIFDEEVNTVSGIIQLIIGSTAFVVLDLKEWSKMKPYLASVYWTPVTLPIACLFFFKTTGIGQRSVSAGKHAKKDLGKHAKKD